MCARGPHTTPCASTTSRKEVDDARIRTPGRMLDGCAHHAPTTITSFDCARYMRTLTREMWNIAESATARRLTARSTLVADWTASIERCSVAVLCKTVGMPNSSGNPWHPCGDEPARRLSQAPPVRDHSAQKSNLTLCGQTRPAKTHFCKQPQKEAPLGPRSAWSPAQTLHLTVRQETMSHAC